MKKLFGIVILLILLLFGFVFADTNGIWHLASDVKGGVFGEDEQPVANYTFINPVYFEDNAYVNGNKVAFLDSTDKVPLENLPFHKGDLLSPEDRPLVSGLSSYYTSYFNISNLGISGVEASGVREGLRFGPNEEIVGSLSNDVICTSAGGNANCGATSVMIPGIFYTMVNTNSASGTNYCTKIDIGSDGSVTSTNVITAGVCSYVENCDSSSQTKSFYSDGTSCGGGNICISGSCINPVPVVYNVAGTYTYTVPTGITSLTVGLVGGGGGGAGAYRASSCSGNSPNFGGGGGGGSGILVQTIPVTPGEVISLNIGSGGAGGYGNANGGNGGSTSFKHLSVTGANGGKRGYKSGSSFILGAGGLGSNGAGAGGKGSLDGDSGVSRILGTGGANYQKTGAPYSMFNTILYSGGIRKGASSPYGAAGGGGGAGWGGNGGDGGDGDGSPQNGYSGTACGAGGGGAGTYGCVSRTGGAGHDGCVVIKVY